MRGEHKTPGGKLVAVEFSVRNGAIREVSVTGDFFLYPEDALGLLTASLEGAPASSAPEDIAQRIQEILDGDIDLVGSSAEGIAIAVARALENTDSDEISHQ